MRGTRQRHGLTAEDWQALADAQGGRCYLCGEPLPEDRSQIAVDHDHRCCPRQRSCPRCRRGLSHAACNTLIGLAGDDTAKLHTIADNLAAAIARLGDLGPPPEPEPVPLGRARPRRSPRPRPGQLTLFDEDDLRPGDEERTA